MGASRTEDAGQAVLDRIRDGLDRGELPADALTDETLFDLEMEHLFEDQWVFLAHESEIPDPGDYVVRSYLEEEFIVIRDESGTVRVLENACCHQGMEVCRTERGNASHLRCTYHGWTYDNTGDLVGVPFREQAYGDDLDRVGRQLSPAPRQASYNGLVFASLNPEVEPLEDYLGDYRFYLDFFTGRSPAGMEFVGPQRRVLDFNWKAVMINAFGDFYHSMVTHRSASEVGAVDTTNAYGGEENRIDPEIGYHINAGPGGTITREGYLFEGAPEAVKAGHRETLSDEQWALVDVAGTPGASGILPNVTINNSIGVPGPEESVPFTYARKLRPLGPRQTEVLTWNVVEADAPEDYKERTREAFVFLFGTSGLYTQDDTVNWQSITRVSGGGMAERRQLKYNMALEADPDPDVVGPGRAYPTVLTEANPRHFLAKYVESLEEATP